MKSEAVKPWAIARSIYKGVSVHFQKSAPNSYLRPKFLGKNLISFGLSNDLVFSRKNIIKIQEKKFALPELRFFLNNPFSTFRKILTLKKFGNYIYSIKPDRDYFITIMTVSIEATAVYMNNHRKCIDIMADDKGAVSFCLKDSNLPIISLLKNQEGNWCIKTGKIENDINVELTFKNIDVGIQSCLGKINPLVAAASGDYEVNGYLPLLDKVGYCARLVGSEIPILK